MKTAYITGDWSEGIEVITVVRETEKCVFHIPSGGGTERRKLKDHSYHLTWGAARDFLVRRERERVKSIEHQLEAAKAKLARIESMKAAEEVRG